MSVLGSIDHAVERSYLEAAARGTRDPQGFLAYCDWLDALSRWFEAEGGWVGQGRRHLEALAHAGDPTEPDGRVPPPSKR